MKTITTVENVIKAFINEEEAQTANNSLSTKKIGNSIFLIGYDHAVYAINSQGQFYFNAGWYGYSSTTSRHYNKAHALCARAAGPQGVCLQSEDKTTLEEAVF